MNPPEAPPPADTKKASPSLEGVALGRVILASVAMVASLITLYLSFWVLVRGIGLVSSKLPVALPLLVGFGVTMLLQPALPTRAQIVDGSVKVPVASLRRYLRGEVIAAVLGIGIGVGALVVRPGALIPTRSEVGEVRLDEKTGTATIQFERKLTEAPPFVNGLLVAVAVAALGTAFAAVRGAHGAWQLRDVVRGMDEER